MSDIDYTGPLNFAVFAIPAGANLGAATAELRSLAAGHAAEILDIELVSRSENGEASREPLPADLAAIETDLLHADDLEAIVEDLGAGEQALVVIYEDRTLARFAESIVAVSGRELWAGGLDAADLDDPENADTDSVGTEN